MSPRFISTAEYAARRGIDPRSVRNAIAAGRLSRSVHRQGRNYLIDPQAADAEWEATTAPDRGGKHDRAPAGGEGFAEARRLRVIAEADLLTLVLRDKRARPVPARGGADVRRQLAAQVETEFLSLPKRLAPIIAEEGDQHAVHAILTAAIRQALVSVARSS